MSGEIYIPSAFESAVCVKWAEALGLCSAVPVLGVGEQVPVIPGPSVLQTPERDAVARELEQAKIRERQINNLTGVGVAAPKPKPGTVPSALEELTGLFKELSNYAKRDPSLAQPVQTSSTVERVSENVAQAAESAASVPGKVIQAGATAVGSIVDSVQSTALRFGIGVGLAGLAAVALIAWIKD